MSDTQDTSTPRAVALINGTFRLPIYEMTVMQNAFFEADKFRVSVPLNALPIQYDIDWFSQQEELRVALYIGYPADPFSYNESDLTGLLLGNADTITVQWDQNVLEIAGRDLTGLMIDAPVQQNWLNQTASQVAETIAKAYGFKTDITKTTQKLGAFVGKDWARLAKHSSWDLLAFMANNTAPDGQPWVCYVQWDTLYFGPRPKGTPFHVRWGSVSGEPGTVTRLKTRRNLLVSKNLTVVVKGFNLGTGATIVGSVESKGHNAFGQTYVYVLPNLTPAEAKAKAAAKLQELMQHELSVEFDMPGDASLGMQSIVRVSETGTEWDADFYPYSVTHEFGPSMGYEMRGEAKSHAPQTVIA